MFLQQVQQTSRSPHESQRKVQGAERAAGVGDRHSY